MLTTEAERYDGNQQVLETFLLLKKEWRWRKETSVSPNYIEMAWLWLRNPWPLPLSQNLFCTTVGPEHSRLLGFEAQEHGTLERERSVFIVWRTWGGVSFILSI